MSTFNPCLKQIFLFLAVIIAVTAKLQAQQQGGRELLPAQLNEQWRAESSTVEIDAKHFSTLSDASLYAEHGLRKFHSRTYTNGRSTDKVEIFDLGFSANAYGLYTLNQANSSSNQIQFYQGPYLVSIRTVKPGTGIDPSLITVIKQRLPSPGSELPILPSKLPSQGLVANSERYIIGPVGLEKLEDLAKFKSAINFQGGVEIVTAEYQHSSGRLGLAVIEYYTPQLASDGYSQLENIFNQMPQEERETTLLKRTGNYAVIAVRVTDKTRGQALIDQVKYAPKVYWEARKLNDIPLEFRPPDPAVLEEASQTANVIIRTFYWIGIMIVSALFLGITSGAAFFYWNRRRRRKLGMEDMFSDAGGTVRLNLDDYLLSSELNNQRLVVNGEKDGQGNLP